MFRYGWVPGLFIVIFIVCVSSPISAQADECTQNEVTYDETIYKTVQTTLSLSEDNRLCFEGEKGDSITINAQITQQNKYIIVSVGSFSIPGSSKQESSREGPVVLSYVLPEDGAYYILVASLGAQEFSYRLTLKNQNADDSDRSVEESASTDTPRTGTGQGCTVGSFILIPGYSSEFFIDDNSFLRSYCFFGVADTEYRINVSAESGDLDPFVFVMDAEANDVLGSNDDISRTNTDSELDFVPEETGVYIIAVARVDLAEGETEGDFEILIENRTTDEPDTCPEAFTMPTEMITIPEGEEKGLHVFCFNGEEGHFLSVTAEAVRGDLDMGIHVTRTSLEPIQSGESTDDILTLRARITRDEPYLIMIFDSSYEGGFTLSFEYD